MVAYLLFDDPACRLVVSGCSGRRPRAGSSGCRDLQNLIGPQHPKVGSKQAFIFSCLGLRPIKVLLFAKLNSFFKAQRDFWGRWPPMPCSSPAALHSSLRASASQSAATWEPRLLPCYFWGLARTSSRDPQNDPDDLDRVGKNETATSIVLKVNTVAPKVATTKKTEARPSRDGTSSSPLTLEVFSGVGGSGRRPVSPPTPGGARRGGQ